MSSISGFWAGTYFYPEANVPNVNFDCELNQSGARLSGEITESHAPGQMLVARLLGDIDGNTISFIKTYKTSDAAFSWEIAYSGQVSPKKNHITGLWHVGVRQGTFEMHRDAGELQDAQIRETADDPSVKV